jgi:hypothetical protein
LLNKSANPTTIERNAWVMIIISVRGEFIHHDVDKLGALRMLKVLAEFIIRENAI